MATDYENGPRRDASTDANVVRQVINPGPIQNMDHVQQVATQQAEQNTREMNRDRDDQAQTSHDATGHEVAAQGTAQSALDQRLATAYNNQKPGQELDLSHLDGADHVPGHGTAQQALDQHLALAAAGSRGRDGGNGHDGGDIGPLTQEHAGGREPPGGADIREEFRGTAQELLDRHLSSDRVNHNLSLQWGADQAHQNVIDRNAPTNTYER